MYSKWVGFDKYLLSKVVNHCVYREYLNLFNIENGTLKANAIQTLSNFDFQNINIMFILN